MMTLDEASEEDIYGHMQSLIDEISKQDDDRQRLLAECESRLNEIKLHVQTILAKYKK
jgi:hypothetical protein